MDNREFLEQLQKATPMQELKQKRPGGNIEDWETHDSEVLI
jgi:hypothetical protein